MSGLIMVLGVGKLSFSIYIPLLKKSTNISLHRLPSTNDVYMHVQYIIIYFNTTASEAGEDADFNKFCSFAGGPNAKGTICYITDKEGVSSLASDMSLEPPASNAPNRSETVSMVLLVMLVGGSMFLLH